MPNLVKRKFGKLFVLHSMAVGRRKYWGCLCECGRSKHFTTKELLKDGVTNCGCVFVPKCAGHVGPNQYLYQGKLRSGQECAALANTNYRTFYWRIWAGWTLEDAIHTPARKLTIKEAKV